MTEKRFTLNRVGKERIIDGIIDNQTDELLDNQMDFCERLNALHEENTTLKSENMALTGANKILKENNKRLKEEIKDFQDLLAGKEEELLKPVIRMIDERINKVDTISAETLKDLRKEITDND